MVSIGQAVARVEVIEKYSGSIGGRAATLKQDRLSKTRQEYQKAEDSLAKQVESLSGDAKEAARMGTGDKILMSLGMLFGAENRAGKLALQVQRLAASQELMASRGDALDQEKSRSLSALANASRRSDRLSQLSQLAMDADESSKLGVMHAAPKNATANRVRDKVAKQETIRTAINGQVEESSHGRADRARSDSENLTAAVASAKQSSVDGQSGHHSRQAWASRISVGWMAAGNAMLGFSMFGAAAVVGAATSGALGGLLLGSLPSLTAGQSLAKGRMRAGEAEVAWIEADKASADANLAAAESLLSGARAQIEGAENVSELARKMGHGNGFA